MAKRRVVHLLSSVRDGRTRVVCGESGPAVRAGDPAAIASDVARATCATCLRNRPMSAEDAARAESLVGAKSAGSLDERSVYVSLRLTSIGLRRRVDVAEIRDGAANDGTAAGEPDDDVLHVSKEIFDAKELREVRRVMSEVYGWMWRNGYRTRLRAGFHRLPFALVEPMVEFFAVREAEVAEHLEAFVARYDEVKANARRRLGKLYCEDDYPSAEAIRAAFRVEYFFTSFQVPGQLSAMSRAVYEAERRKAADRAEDERRLVVAALREQFHGLVAHMAGVLEPGPDGRPKRFRDSALESVREFLSLFEARNIGGDAALDPLVAEARRLVDGVDTKALKTDDELRAATRDGFARVREAMSGMVVARAKRAVKLAD